jgi:hypothetical protein
MGQILRYTARQLVSNHLTTDTQPSCAILHYWGAALMLAVPPGMRVWLVADHTDMRRGMNGLAAQVQQSLGRDPHAGDLFVFRGRRGDLIKILWHDGLGMSLYAKRLERRISGSSSLSLGLR